MRNKSLELFCKNFVILSGLGPDHMSKAWLNMSTDNWSSCFREIGEKEPYANLKMKGRVQKQWKGILLCEFVSKLHLHVDSVVKTHFF